MSGADALGPGAEFDLIRRIVAGADGHEGLVLGPGDDAAVLEGGLVWTCDLVIEDVHFRRGWLEPSEIGQRAVRSALSDLAAMAAEPVAVLVAIAGCRADYADGTLAAVGEGARAAAESFGAALAGGDVTRSPGPLIVDVSALGRADPPALRSGGRPGDGLWVSGALGGAAAAVRILEGGAALPASLRARLARPEPRFRAAAALAATGSLHALMDLSDGLGGDAGHLAAASEVAIVIDAARVPVDPAATEALGGDTARELAISGGEDYELLFAADPGFEDAAAALAERLGLALTRIGRLEAGAGVRLDGTDAGEPSPRGWDHFA